MWMADGFMDGSWSEVEQYNVVRDERQYCGG